MTAVHVSTEPDPAERGRELGRAHGAAVRATLAAYERMFAALVGLRPAEVDALGRRVGEALAPDHPEVVAEIAGIAAGAGVAAEGLLAVNARTEILAGRSLPECSVIGALPERSGGATILAQNWDWHPDLAESLVLWTVVEDGRRFTTLTEAGMLAKIGLNDRGLGLCLNILDSTLDGVPVHVLCRLILQGAGELGEAEAILAAAEATASSCFSVAHATGAGEGAMAALELSPAGVRAVEPERGVLLHTNHFADESSAERDRGRRRWPDSGARLQELAERIRHGSERLDADAIKDALRSHRGGRLALCCHDHLNPSRAKRQGTLASICMRLDRGRMELAPGAPCSARYRAVADT